MSDGRNPVIFLDRDGTIHVDKGYLYKKEEVEYLDGVVQALSKLCTMGYLLIIVTNQSGIARGYYTEQDFLGLDTWMRRDLEKRGVIISRTYYCPHYPKGIVARYAKKCTCRKPGTGLFWQAQAEFEIDMGRSYAVGDRMRDLMICRESGVKGILLASKGIFSDGIRGCRDWREVLGLITADTERGK